MSPPWLAAWLWEDWEGWNTLAGWLWEDWEGWNTLHLSRFAQQSFQIAYTYPGRQLNLMKSPKSPVTEQILVLVSLWYCAYPGFHF